jgi:uncharacterized protein (DUF3084 family)
MGKKLIWVDDDFEAEILAISDICGMKEQAKKAFARIDFEIQTNIEAMNDNVESIKKVAQQVISSYDETVKEECEKIYTAWETADTLRQESTKRLSSMKQMFKDVQTEIRDLQKCIGEINWYGATGALELIQKYSAMSASDKELLYGLVHLRDVKNVDTQFVNYRFVAPREPQEPPIDTVTIINENRT